MSEERVHGMLKSFYDKLPDCEHGEKRGYCEQCKEEDQKQYEAACQERLRREEEEKAARKAAEMEARKNNPWEWLHGYAVPLKYKDASFDNFIGGDQLKKIVRSFPENDMALSGMTGCGKTHLSVAILREMVINDTIQKGEARFTTVPRLLMEIRESFKEGSYESEKTIVDRYVDYPILILDDLGADRATEWAIETLYLIIDGRDSNLRPTLITTNLSVKDIEHHYGARIASRISGMRIINIGLPDYRKKR